MMFNEKEFILKIKENIPLYLLNILSRVSEYDNGGIYLSGGFLRDLYLNSNYKDIDIFTSTHRSIAIIEMEVRKLQDQKLIKNVTIIEFTDVLKLSITELDGNIIYVDIVCFLDTSQGDIRFNPSNIFDFTINMLTYDILNEKISGSDNVSLEEIIYDLDNMRLVINEYVSWFTTNVHRFAKRVESFKYRGFELTPESKIVFETCINKILNIVMRY